MLFLSHFVRLQLSSRFELPSPLQILQRPHCTYSDNQVVFMLSFSLLISSTAFAYSSFALTFSASRFRSISSYTYILYKYTMLQSKQTSFTCSSSVCLIPGSNSISVSISRAFFTRSVASSSLFSDTSKSNSQYIERSA